MVSSLVSIPGYQISEELYNGSRTVVYRGYREIDDKPVVIKLLKNPYPSFSELVQFRNQYIIAKNLHSSGIIQTYSLEPYQNGYALVMEDFGGISLKEYFTSRVRLLKTSLEEFLQIAIAICNSLDILYRERIIHKDIKPSNILINPETKQVKLIDFSIASLLPRETQTLNNTNVFEGTLAYISPEQTGRMNRLVDYRTDFYSLGVTFYKLLTGELPFKSNDAMELVHCHIAKQPPSVNREEIPQALSNIVMKLMAKNAEDRYQSAFGLKFDLETCLHQLKETGKIENFEIGQRDIYDRFIIPDKLYGRETEVSTLLQAFERVSIGATDTLCYARRAEIMLVEGFSGIGKTAVVNEVHKPIVRQRGFFIKGKYDQFQRNIPFSAFVQAFRDLMGQLLTQSDIQLEQWKKDILGALGENAQVIIDVIPELEEIVGRQPLVASLSGNAAQNRFNLLFHKFIQVFSNEKHPLVIFVDDLQWADSASLKLMQLLLDEADTSCLLIIGAYRDNEVYPTHPLILTLDELSKNNVARSAITLKPLSTEALGQLIADTLNCTIEVASPLMQLVYQKTKGNPFFCTQFLKSLYDDGFITFQNGYWQCDISQIQLMTVADDVVEFMASQLQKLPLNTQHILKLAACVGNTFDLDTLAIISQQAPTLTATFLWRALREGLILPTNEIYKFYQADSNWSSAINDGESHYQLPTNHQSPKYKFLHDRVQQAAYSLIPEGKKQETHLKIGELLLEKIQPELQEGRIFDVVNQLNAGAELIADSHQKIKLINLNLIAGRKAKAATAYSAASEYLLTGINYLPADSWRCLYDLSLALYTEIIEAEYCKGNYEQSVKFGEVVLQNATNKVDWVKIYQFKILIHNARNQLIEAIDIGLEFLEYLKITLANPEDGMVIDLPTLEEIENFPKMTSLESLAAMQILVALIPPAFAAKPNVWVQIILTLVKLSIKQGNSPESAYAYAQYGIVMCGLLANFEAGYHAGKLGINLISKFENNKTIQCKINLVFNFFIRHWKECAKLSIDGLQNNIHIALDAGDFEYTGYSVSFLNTLRFLTCEFLGEIEQSYQKDVDLLVSIKQEYCISLTNIFLQVSQNLLGKTASVTELIGESFNEFEEIPRLQAINSHFALHHLYTVKTILSYLFGDSVQSVANAILSESYSEGVFVANISAAHKFYYSLALLADYPHVSKSKQEEYLNQISANQEKMQLWAESAPQNFLHKLQLVSAEKYRVLGQKAEAIEFYDKAISGAKANEYIPEVALANELAAKFYLDWGFERIAQEYMTQAYYGYARWGAKAKVGDLEKRYPQLLTPIFQQARSPLTTNETISTLRNTTGTCGTADSNSSVSVALDLTTILKASQTISGKIELEKLLESLLSIVIENAGADKCVLMLMESGNLLVRGLALLALQNNQNTKVDFSSILTNPQPVDESTDVPVALINTVKRSLQPAVIIDATVHPQFINDPYIQQQQPKSILCTPILNQGKLLGILYLENQIATGAFSGDRVELLNLLCSQAAISLENAQLYEREQQKSLLLEQALDNLQNAQLQIVQSEKMSALGNLVAGVAHEMNNPLGFIAASLKQTKPAIADLTKHLKLYQETFLNKSEEIIDHAEEIDLDYTLEDLPKVIDSMTMACDRLKNISTSLRTFSRADKDYKVPFNIHEGIDSTILILKHRLKANEQRPAIEVITEYGNLPKIECFPGQLNQVFMNIIANAIDALEESNIGRSFEEIKINHNRITITTSINTNKTQVVISLKDNGKGMSESIKERIFENLFTTKTVGKGTGLGLAIVRQIVVEKHGGTINVNSVPDLGAEFTISLPVV